MDERIYRDYPRGGSSPKFYGLPKIPLMPIVSSKNIVTYAVAKELAIILLLLVVKTIHHVEGTHKFVTSIWNIPFIYWFVCLPVDPSISIIWDKLGKGHELQNRTNISVEHIIKLHYRLTNTYFLFQA